MSRLHVALVVAMAAGACGGESAADLIPTDGCWPDTVVVPASGDLAEDIAGVWVGIQNAAPVYWQFRTDGTVVTNRLSDVDDGVSESIGSFRVVESSIQFLDDSGDPLTTYDLTLDGNDAWRQPSWDMRKCLTGSVR